MARATTTRHSSADDGRGSTPLSVADVPRPVKREQLTGAERWMRPLSITIDGPAGSGKSTVARLVAEHLGFQYVDTGATYRALGWLAIERGMSLDDGDRLRGLAIAQPASLGYADGRWTTCIAGHDVTDEIRTPRIDEAASKVARHAGVRDVMVARQRQLSLQRDSVLDGRDCGTNVRPDADLKLYVTADFEERVRRRGAQFSDAGNGEDDGHDVARGLRERDERDAPQSASAGDAVLVDTTGISIDEAVQTIVDMWISRRHDLLDDEVTGGRSAREWIEREFEHDFDRALRITRQLWRRGFRLRAHGVQRVPERNCLFIANHSSVWDPAFVIVPLNRPVRYMGKVELTRMPLLSTLGDSIGMFPVRRGAGDRVAMHIGESVLRNGQSLGVFPEGTRIYQGNLARPRLGAARLALVTGVPMVPVAIYGNRWSESLFRVSVAFGRPHDFSHLRATPANIERATEAVWNDVNELWCALKEDRWKS